MATGLVHHDTHGPGGRPHVELSEHVPVSELDDVKVELEPESTVGYTLAANDGIATWKVPLAPGEQRTVDLAFHVDAPSDYDTGAM